MSVALPIDSEMFASRRSMITPVRIRFNPTSIIVLAIKPNRSSSHAGDHHNRFAIQKLIGDTVHLSRDKTEERTDGNSYTSSYCFRIIAGSIVSLLVIAVVVVTVVVNVTKPSVTNHAPTTTNTTSSA